MDTLAFNYTLTTAGRIRDLHPLEFAHAGQTKKEEDCSPSSAHGKKSYIALLKD